MNFDNLKDQVSNLTLYDIKAGVRKVQNGMLVFQEAGTRLTLDLAVMNYTEMEAKVAYLAASLRGSANHS